MSGFEMFFVRQGKITGRNNYRIDGTKDMTEGEVMSDFVKQFYAEQTDIPREILIEHRFEDNDLVKDWLKEKKQGAVELLFPQKGEKKRLIEMVHKNAEIAAENYFYDIDFDKMMQPVKLYDKTVTPTTIARAAGYSLEQVDKAIGFLGEPLAIKSYKPYHSKD